MGEIMRVALDNPEKVGRVIRAKAKGLISDRVTANTITGTLIIELTDDGFWKLGGKIIGKAEPES